MPWRRAAYHDDVAFRVFSIPEPLFPNLHPGTSIPGTFIPEPSYPNLYSRASVSEPPFPNLHSDNCQKTVVPLTLRSRDYNLDG